MVYKVKKLIQQYNLVDLLEILQYPNHPEYNQVKVELERRNPAKRDVEIARKGLGYRNRTRNKPLSFIEILYCILTPLIAPKSKFTSDKDIDESFEDQLSEFEYFNESKKARHLKICRLITQFLYSFIFIAFIITLIFLYIINS